MPILVDLRAGGFRFIWFWPGWVVGGEWLTRVIDGIVFFRKRLLRVTQSNRGTEFGLA